VAHYYFNIFNGLGATTDDEGSDCPDLRAARDRAAEGVRSILCEDLRINGIVDLRGRIETSPTSREALS
jgi:hypothetical protein